MFNALFIQRNKSNAMTIKSFWADPYETSHTTQVKNVVGNDIELNSTIFFAFSGGQESDEGSIGGYPVIAAKKSALNITYTLPEGYQLEAGQSVDVLINGERRQRLMRLHFAAELILELFYKTFGDIKKIGAHISQDKSRIDFFWPESITNLLPDLASKANEIILEDHQIQTGFDDEINERRYWKIEGFSKVPCGGTHVKSTAEIGTIRLKRVNIGKGKERVEIYLND